MRSVSELLVKSYCYNNPGKDKLCHISCNNLLSDSFNEENVTNIICINAEHFPHKLSKDFKIKVNGVTFLVVKSFHNKLLLV